MAEPFDSLEPATDGDVAWASGAVDPYPPYRVGVTIPRGHEAYVRVLTGRHDWDWWEREHPKLLRRPAIGDEAPDPREYRGQDIDDDADLVDALLPHLRAHGSARAECVFGMWTGFGVWRRSTSASLARAVGHGDGVLERVAAPLRRRQFVSAERKRQQSHDRQMAVLEAFIDSCPILPAWGGRDMFVVRGPLEGVSSIGAPVAGRDDVYRQVPQLWWPDDRAWTVAHEIDNPWFYVGGTQALIDGLMTDKDLVTVISHPDDAW